MKFLVSLFWGYIFSFIAIFIITAILGSNEISQGTTVLNCSILAVLFTLTSVGLNSLIKENKK
ncbi:MULTISPECIES: DUF2929 family protein [unclassified Gemella]|uniref:DUF2929 family protein n=1 Tax=unclassified Gemella TaxID=2624949 RepID=UPI001072FEEF|nr:MULTISPECIES: DUF2929 family protein [unclassified Gemella]MBF0709669.1 DUF2929 family protein [Gemella sp. GL1.1]MBF0746912.1 DUF2929 family protein [Gemella sp. 19428wG2_WT2a]NYS27013.1 DUF2929 family protein [Gemella sp. GL1]TFU59138.1 DUF2929 family protein [Gemella sp. WT2a]